MHISLSKDSSKFFKLSVQIWLLTIVSYVGGENCRLNKGTRQEARASNDLGWSGNGIKIPATIIDQRAMPLCRSAY